MNRHSMWRALTLLIVAAFAVQAVWDHDAVSAALGCLCAQLVVLDVLFDLRDRT